MFSPCDDIVDSLRCRNKPWQRISAVLEQLEILSLHQVSSNAVSMFEAQT